MIVYLNGQFLRHEDASLDPLDRGLLFGEGLFETIRVEEGQPLFFDDHLARLLSGTRILEIPWRQTSEELLSICHQVLDQNNLTEARLRLTITAGDGDGERVTSDPMSPPTLLVAARPLDTAAHAQQRDEGWRLVLSSYARNPRSPLVRFKSLSYAENILARREARRGDADEALLLNSDGLIAEGAMSNIFVATDEHTLLTPPVEDGALPGILRKQLLKIATKEGITVQETSITMDQLFTASEVLMTNVLIEVMPVVTLDNVPVGGSEPGPLAELLQSRLRELVQSYLAQVRLH